MQLPAGQSSLTVRLSNGGDDFVEADAIRLEQVYLPELDVTINGVRFESGELFDFGTVLELSDAPATVVVTNLGVLPLELSVPALATPGGVTLATAWTGGSLSTGQSMFFTVSLNTIPLPGDDERPYSAEVTFTSNDVDETRFVLPMQGRVSDHRTIDDGDAGFSQSHLPGQGFITVVRDLRQYGSDYLYHDPGAGYNKVRWTFTDLVPGETYEVSATWVGGTNRPSNAPYTITAGGAPIVVRINQQLNPDDFGNGRKWEIIAPVTLVNGSRQIVVELSDNADGYVQADAVRIDVPDPHPLLAAGPAVADAGGAELSSDQVAPLLADAIGHWQSTGLNPAEMARLSDVQVIVAELPGNLLGLASAYGTTIWLDHNAAGHGWQREVRGERLEVRGEQGAVEPGAGSVEPGAWSGERGANWRRTRAVITSAFRHSAFRIPLTC